jgi:hypothetical protein
LRQKFCLHCGHSFPDPEGAAGSIEGRPILR